MVRGWIDGQVGKFLGRCPCVDTWSRKCTECLKTCTALSNTM